MTDQFRAMCEQLMELVEGKRYDGSAVVARARALLAQPVAEGVLPLKERPDFIAGYREGLADRRRITECEEAERPAAQPVADGEVAELMAWLREYLDCALQSGNSKSIKNHCRLLEVLERLASDNAGLTAAADSLWADNVSLLDN